MQYEIRETVPDPETFVALREAADVSPRSLEAARRGLPNTLFGVSAVVSGADEPLMDETEADETEGEETWTDETGPDGTVVDGTEAEGTVGMARIVGDGGCVYHVCDMVVRPEHQRRGLGSRMMDALMAYVETHAPETAYVNLMADVDGFYERWGFERTTPASKAMYLPSD